MTKLDLYNKLNGMINNGTIHCKIKWEYDTISITYPLGSGEDIEQIVLDLIEDEDFTYGSWKYEHYILIEVN